MLKFKKGTIAVCVALILATMHIPEVTAQCEGKIDGKEIYIPKDLRDNDFTSDSSQWSYCRMATSENFVVFWQKGFGNDLSKAPDLDGHNMKVDLDNLIERLESYYVYYRDTLKFVLPGSKSEKYRMMVMLNYSLEGTAYGGDYDGVTGALWIAPNRVQDKKLNCIAHELGHSFQSQIGADGTGESWGGGGIFEMTSQWMLWEVNHEWVTDELYHWEAFRKQINLPFLAIDNIYHSPYVLEYWSMKRGKTVIADLFREGKRGEDPAQTYMKKFGLSLEGFADEMLDCYSRLVTFDFPRVKESHRKYACQLHTDVENDGKWISPVEKASPMRYGFNVIDLPLPAEGKSVKVNFEATGEDLDNKSYTYKIVAVDSNGNAKYSDAAKGVEGKVSYKRTVGDDIEKMFLVVVGYPKNDYGDVMGNPYERRDNAKQKKDVYYDYRIRVK